jgi:hypothetical protein
LGSHAVSCHDYVDDQNSPLLVAMLCRLRLRLHHWLRLRLQQPLQLMMSAVSVEMQFGLSTSALCHS